VVDWVVKTRRGHEGKGEEGKREAINTLIKARSEREMGEGREIVKGVGEVSYCWGSYWRKGKRNRVREKRGKEKGGQEKEDNILVLCFYISVFLCF